MLSLSVLGLCTTMSLSTPSLCTGGTPLLTTRVQIRLYGTSNTIYVTHLTLPYDLRVTGANRPLASVTSGDAPGTKGGASVRQAPRRASHSSFRASLTFGPTVLQTSLQAVRTDGRGGFVRRGKLDG